MSRAFEREAVDVEELVRLAYGVHMVDRVTPAGVLAMRGPPSIGGSSTAMIGAMLALGATVDTSTAGATFLGRAHQMQAVADDFLDVHDAVLRLPRMWADIPGGQAAEFVVWDEAGLVHDARRLGFDVDARRNEWGSITSARIAPLRHDGAAPAGPKAYRNGVILAAQAADEGEGESCPLYPALRSIEAPMRPLYLIEPAVQIIVNAKAGTRPDLPRLHVESWRPVYGGKRKAVGRAPVWETPPAEVALQRATYAAWRFGLAVLAGMLDGLDRFTVTGPRVAEAPWIGDNDRAPVGHVLENLTG